MKILYLLFLPLFCFSQNDNYAKLKALPKTELEKAVNDSILKLDSHDLWNFLKASNDYQIDLKSFNTTLIQKMETSNWAFDLHFLFNILMEQKTKKSVLENILNQKKGIWDKGMWSEKFWKIIRENQLNVTPEIFYSITEKGEKKYNLKLYIEEKIKNNEIGRNPLLVINSSIVSYSENQLLTMLELVNIKDIQITPSKKSVEIYGKRGADGMLNVLTR